MKSLLLMVVVLVLFALIGIFPPCAEAHGGVGSFGNAAVLVAPTQVVTPSCGNFGGSVQSFSRLSVVSPGFNSFAVSPSFRTFNSFGHSAVLAVPVNHGGSRVFVNGGRAQVLVNPGFNRGVNVNVNPRGFGQTTVRVR